ncbi:MAG: hypothetical protein AABX47_06580, partial [Nanoarchaeota archaeon]
MIPKYIGNGAYCYANCIAMLLDSIGEDISPGTAEVLSGVGIGAFWDENRKTGLFQLGLNTPGLCPDVFFN